MFDETDSREAFPVDMRGPGELFIAGKVVAKPSTAMIPEDNNRAM